MARDAASLLNDRERSLFLHDNADRAYSLRASGS